ncbi:hypothetical protein ACHAWU_004175 [Discostella pseudostelligera]|uniref:Uncharacterized protein n=1 Tax=Discostella pseudostelligera TaxID=259834 RepID=A0ABD3M755_9STRA
MAAAGTMSTAAFLPSTAPHQRHTVQLRSTLLSKKAHEFNQSERVAHTLASSHNIIFLFLWDIYSSLIVYVTLLTSTESIVGLILTVGATLLAYYLQPNYNVASDSGYYVDWNGELPSVLLSFAVVTPLSQSIAMGYQRREVALKALATYRAAIINLYVAHASWDWTEYSKGKGRRGCVEHEEEQRQCIDGNNIQEVKKNGDDTDNDAHEQMKQQSPRSTSTTSSTPKPIDWLDHSDTTLRHLIHLSDSLCQYLTLPTATRARHRVTNKGRSEADIILSTGQQIFTSSTVGRTVAMSGLTEALKYRGLPGNEAARMRQWEHTATLAMEELRIVKEYRTLQGLRVFGRLFSLFLPPFYATSYVQVAIDTGSLSLGIALGVMTSIALTGLFECVRQLEDPFVSHVTLDGIDVREELVVLAYKELMVARAMVFPTAGDFELTVRGEEEGI